LGTKSDQEMMRVDPVVDDEATQGRHVLLEIALLQGQGFRLREPQIFPDVLPDAQLHLVEQPAGGRIKRVVEVENPGTDRFCPTYRIFRR
jgi:hypothetical protein